MRDKRLLQVVTFMFAVFMVAVMAWLTMPESDDPCANSQADISAAVLAGEDGDQDALVNRAIILKGKCEKETGDNQ